VIETERILFLCSSASRRFCFNAWWKETLASSSTGCSLAIYASADGGSWGASQGDSQPSQDGIHPDGRSPTLPFQSRHRKFLSILSPEDAQADIAALRTQAVRDGSAMEDSASI
jgi:hypothetical protein